MELSEYDGNRVEVLRLLCAMLSSSMYTPVSRYDCCSNVWLEIVTGADVPYADLTLRTLLNSVLGMT